MWLYIFLFVLIVVIYFFGKDLRHMWFAYFMYLFTKDKNPQYDELKKDLFKSLSSHKSHVPELRKSNSIRILEVGVGTGVNFSYYPDGTHLVVIDPNPHFASYYNENRAKFSNIKSEDIKVCAGEDMDDVESNSIDVVVMTLVMCSVNDIKKMVQQIERVLAPGGKFYFWEHVLEFDDNHSTRRTIQQVLTKSMFWPFFFDGCYLNRDMLADIKAAGFSDVDFKRFHAPTKNWFFSVITPHLSGVATK